MRGATPLLMHFKCENMKSADLSMESENRRFSALVGAIGPSKS